MSELPMPPVPADCDLRGMQFMPLFGDRLFTSQTWVRASDEARVAMLKLWWHSFAHEVPASSLPEDERLICEYSGFGSSKSSLRAFRRMKGEILRGWRKHSDGRLYHAFVAEQALEAWGRRCRDRDRKQKWRERHRHSDSDGTVTETVPSPSPERGRHHRQGQDSDSDSDSKSKNGGGGSAHAREADLDVGQPTPAEQVAQHFVAERDRLWPNTSRLPGPMMTIRSQAQQFLDRGAPPELLLEVMTRGMERSAADGKSPPSTLSAYQASLADAVASHLRPMPDGEADPFPASPAVRPNGFKSRSTIQAEKDALARKWREQGGIGPDPADPRSPNYPGGSS